MMFFLSSAKRINATQGGNVKHIITIVFTMPLYYNTHPEKYKPMQTIEDISSGEIFMLSLSLFITTQRDATNIIWQTEPMVSTIGVIDS